MKGVLTMAKRKRISNKIQSPNRQAYQKEINRLKAYQRRKEKQGFKFNITLAPEMPKKVTPQKLEEIKSIKPRKLRGQDVIVLQDFKETGEVIGEINKPQDLPSFNYISATENLIDGLPDYVEVLTGGSKADYRVKPYPLYIEKRKLKSIMWDTLSQYENESDYNDYLESVFSELQMWLDPDKLPSTEDELKQVVSTALILIKGTSLTREDIEILSRFDDWL